MLSRSLHLALGLTLASACAGEASLAENLDEVELDEDADTKADGTSELYVRAAETSLWVRTHLTRQDRSGADTFVLRGRTSRNIVDGRAFVFDDVYGAFAQLGPRSFEVSWAVSEIRTLLQGSDQLIGLGVVGGPENVTARVVVRPRLTGYTGSGLYLVYSVRAVVSGGRVVYRVRGRANEPIASLDADADGVDIPDARIIDGSRFEIDLLEDHVLALAYGTGTLNIRGVLASGASVEKSASLILAVSKLGLTSADPYDTWPRPMCTDSVRECVASVAPGTSDLGDCGDAVVVLPCLGTSGAVVDDVAIQATLAALDARLAEPTFRADATGLVGSERADAWLEGLRATAEERVQEQIGGVHPDVPARDAALAAIVEAVIDAAYAEPLTLVDPYAPSPGDPARARHVATDALLAHLAERDWEATALWRPLVVLTREYRARHVASIHAFRAEIDPIDGLSPNSDAYVGDWIGLYTEVELDRATQTVIRVLVEID